MKESFPRSTVFSTGRSIHNNAKRDSPINTTTRTFTKHPSPVFTLFSLSHSFTSNDPPAVWQQQFFPNSTFSSFFNPVILTSFTFAKQSSPTLTSLRLLKRLKSNPTTLLSLQQWDTTMITSTQMVSLWNSFPLWMVVSLGLGRTLTGVMFTDGIDEGPGEPSTPIRSDSVRRINDLPLFRILSMESFTNGCYASHAFTSTHTHQLVHGSSFLRIPHQTLADKINERTGPLRRRERRNASIANRFRHFGGRETVIRILPLRQLNQRNAQRPHITFQFRFVVEHFWSIVPQGSALVIQLGTGVLYPLCQTKVTQLDQAIC